MTQQSTKGVFADSWPMRAAEVRWFNDQVTDFGTRLTKHQTEIDAAIARVDAALADYRKAA